MSQIIKKSSLDDALTDAEKASLARFWDDEIMRETVKKVLLFDLYHNGTLKKGEKPDMLRNFALGLVARNPNIKEEDAGRALKVAWEGICLLEAGFSLIANYQTEKEQIKVGAKNPAR